MFYQKEDMAVQQRVCNRYTSSAKSTSYAGDTTLDQSLKEKPVGPTSFEEREHGERKGNGRRSSDASIFIVALAAYF